MATTTPKESSLRHAGAVTLLSGPSGATRFAKLTFDSLSFFHDEVRRKIERVKKINAIDATKRSRLSLTHKKKKKKKKKKKSKIFFFWIFFEMVYY
jgi:hypothetical protein